MFRITRLYNTPNSHIEYLSSFNLFKKVNFISFSQIFNHKIFLYGKKLRIYLKKKIISTFFFSLHLSNIFHFPKLKKIKGNNKYLNDKPPKKKI